MQMEPVLQTLKGSPVRAWFGFPNRNTADLRPQMPPKERGLDRDELIELFRDKLRSDGFISA